MTEERNLDPPEPVIVRDALGRLLRKVAESKPERGGDFAVVWVRWAESEDVMPWPLEDVWFADGAPVWERRGRHPQMEAINPQDALSRGQYLATARQPA